MTFLTCDKNINIMSGEKIQQSGFYEPIEHTGKCRILKSERIIFLDKGSEAPKILSCQHDIKWRLVPIQ